MSFTHMKKGMILSAVFYICIGVLMVAFPTEIALMLCYLFGGALALIGIVKIVQYFSARNVDSFLFQLDLVLGMLLLVISALFLLQPQAILSIIPIVIGIILLTDAIIKAQLAFQLKRVGYVRWWITLLLAALCMLASVLLITNPFRSNDILIIVAGASFIADGIMDLWSIFYIRKALKMQKEQA